MVKKQTKRTADIENVIRVKNADGCPDSTARVIIRGNITKSPKVSVIMPMHNAQEFLAPCLDSVCGQTLQDIEIICVDDGSTDDTLNILREYARRDHRITILSQNNLTAGVARNAGLSIARGTYLSFLDADDIFDPDMLQIAYNTARKNKSDIVFWNWNILDQIKNITSVSRDGCPAWVQKEIVANPSTNFADFVPDRLFDITNPAPWNKLYSKKFVDNLGVKFQALSCCNDIGFTVSCMGGANVITGLPQALLQYRKTSGNTSNRQNPPDNILKAADYIKSQLISYNRFAALESAFYRGIMRTFYYEYCRCSDKDEQTERYMQFLPPEYHDVFRAVYDQDRQRTVVLIGSDNVCTTIGGAITVYWERARYFARMGYRVICLFYNESECTYDIDNVTLVNLHNKYVDTKSIAERFQRFLRQYHPDLLMFFFPSLVDRYVGDNDISAYNSVLMLHSRPDVYLERNGVTQDRVIRRCQQIKHIQVLLSSFIGMARKYFPTQTITVIPNYVEYPDTVENTHTHKKCIFFSRCDVGKNLTLLVNAFALVHKKHPDWTLDIYGQSEPASYIDKIKRLIDILKLNDVINIYDHSETGREVLRSADIFTFPTYFEGLSLGLVEGCAYGLPAVVLEGASGCNQIITHEYNGLHAKDTPADFADKINYLIEHPSVRRKYAKNARISAQQYSKELVDNAWRQMLIDILNKKIKSDDITDAPKPFFYSLDYIYGKWDDFNPNIDNPRVSIIVPTYNVKNYITECLDSLTSQTFQDIEIICVDDGSMDGTYGKTLAAQMNDTRIKVYKNSANMRQGYCRNFGVSKAKGEYVFFCDSDDWIKPETIELLVAAADKNQTDLCLYNLTCFEDKTGRIIETPAQNFNDLKSFNQSTFTWADCPAMAFKKVEPVLKLYRRQFLIDNDIKFYEGCFFEDTIVHIKSMLLARKYCYIDQAMYMYRQGRAGQTTGRATNTDKFLDIFNYINGSQEFIKSQGMWAQLQEYYLDFALNRIIGYYNRCTDSTKVKFRKLVKTWWHKQDHRYVAAHFPDAYSVINNIITIDRRKLIKSYLCFPWCVFGMLHSRRKIAKITSKKNKLRSRVMRNYDVVKPILQRDVVNALNPRYDTLAATINKLDARCAELQTKLNEMSEMMQQMVATSQPKKAPAAKKTASVKHQVRKPVARKTRTRKRV